MNEIKRQIGLIREVKFIRGQYQSFRLDKLHYGYLFNFFKKHSLFILALIFLLFTQGLIEALLIIFSRNQLSNQQEVWLVPFFWQFLIIFLIFFFVNSYFSIRQEKTLGVWLANSIRRRLFKFYINQPLQKMDQRRKSELIAKISYQLPLVSMGVTNSFFGVLRWLIYVMVVVLISFWSGLNWLLILLAIIIISIIISLSAYFVARRYISQEVTFYSQMIKEIDIDTSEKYFLKNFNQEKVVLNRFDRLVDFDSFFRIRRDLWIRMGFKVVFALLLLLSILTHFFSTDFFAWINLAGPDKKFLILFLMIYFSRALNEGLRIGLYFFPARLGLFLTILRPGAALEKNNIFSFSKDINFYSQKIKLFKEGPYYRNFSLLFSKGGRYLFFKDSSFGKTALAELLAGKKAYRFRAVKLKIDGQRLDYSVWQKFGPGIFYFDPNFYSEKSLMEFILGCGREVNDFSEVERALKIMSAHKEIVALVSSDNNFNSSAGEVLSNKLSAFALCVIHCLVNRPRFIIIDNAWIDLGYGEIEKMLKMLSQELNETVIVVFSRKDNNYLNYHQKYEIGQKIKKID